MIDGIIISMGLWGVTTMAGIVASYWRLRSEIRHLNDTKLDSESLDGDLSTLKADMRQVRESLIEVKTILQRLPCEKRERGNEDCEDCSASSP